MEPTLEFFLQRINEGWWAGNDAHLLSQYIKATYEQIRYLQTQRLNRTIKVLIQEPDRTQFSGFFLGSVCAGAMTFLGNAHWNDKEWKDVATTLSPDLILGNNAESLYRKYSWNNSYKTQPAFSHAVLIPTGGSNEKVRFVWQNWENFFRSIQSLQKFLKQDTLNAVNFLELYHIGGIMPLVRTLITGGRYIDAQWKNIDNEILPTIDHSSFNISLVPTQLERCIQKPQTVEWLKLYDAIFLGGAAPNPELLKQAREMCLPLIPVYGMTETSSMVCAWAKEDFLKSKTLDYIGTTMPNISFIREKNSTSNQHRASWEPIIIQAESLFYGYYPETPRKKLSFETPDEGIFNSEGQLQKVRRRDGIIISGGKKIAPGEIEDLLKSERLVKDICVLGVPNQLWGEEVVAAYIPYRNSNYTEKHLKQFLKENIEPHKIPKRWLCLEVLPRNPQHKINRTALRALFLAHTQQS